MTQTLKIIPVLNGWIVEAGCQKLVYNDVKKMLGELSSYYQSPESYEDIALLRNPVFPLQPESEV